MASYLDGLYDKKKKMPGSGYLDDIYSRLDDAIDPKIKSNPGYQSAISKPLIPTVTAYASPVRPATNIDASGITSVSQGSGDGYRTLSDQNGNIFGSSNLQRPTASTGNTPLARAYESLWKQQGSEAGQQEPASNSIEFSIRGGQGRVISPQTPTESPAMATMRQRREAAVGDLTAKRMEPSTALMPTGGLERGGRINEAKALVQQQDMDNRLNELAQNRAFQALAGKGGSDGFNQGGGRGRGGDNYGRGNRINGRAMPAAETVDQKFQRGLGERDDIVAQTATGKASSQGVLSANLETLVAQQAELQKRIEEERKKQGR